MKCNACWRDLEGRAVATTCGHIFCIEDAGRILSSDSTCPLCEQILSKSHMKSVDLNPNDEWVNMIMAGVPPHCIMKSAFKGVVFWIGQKDVEAQFTVSKAVQLRQKYDEMQTKYMQKIEQVHTAYQKAMKKIQMLEQEKESLVKDKAELEEKYADKSRQKRKLEELYEALRSDYDKAKQRSIAPSYKENMAPRQPAGQYTFASTPSCFEDPMSKAPPDELASDVAPVTPGKSELWPVRPQLNAGIFNMPGAAQGRRGLNGGNPIGNRPAPSSPFRNNEPDMFAPTTNNPSNALRNLLLSPLKRPPSRLRPGMNT